MRRGKRSPAFLAKLYFCGPLSIVLLHDFAGRFSHSKGCEPVHRVRVARKCSQGNGLWNLKRLGYPSDCPSFPTWLYEEPTGVSPAETIGIMVEEFLQSCDVSRRLNLSMVLTSENRAIRLDSIAFPSGFVVALNQDASG